METERNVYKGYAYSYPHKMAYRHFDVPQPLSALWEEEDTSSLFLYFHVPFCKTRCGYCNLLALPSQGDGESKRYLEALSRQAEAVMQSVPSPRFSRLAIGGGTPSFLWLEELERLFALIRRMEVDCNAIPFSFEMSPETIDAEKVALLKESGVTRASLGIQSFVQTETAAVGRPQSRAMAETAVEVLLEHEFSIVNLDLIYGLPGQTVATWRESVERAIDYGVTEIYAYPLYVRPLTGLDGRAEPEIDERLSMYREARDLLLDCGYEQLSMRAFRRRDHEAADTLLYCCQEDGMIGLGPGARSYTRDLHYCSEYGVSTPSVRNLVDAYSTTSCDQFTQAHYGFQLDQEEQVRRYVIKSILRSAGLDIGAFVRMFGEGPTELLPQLDKLLDGGLLTIENHTIRPTEQGLERSDLMGPWLYSDAVKRLIEECELS